MNDDRLESAFRALREADAARAPAIGARRRPRGLHAAVVLAPISALAVAAAVALVIGHAPPASAPSAARPAATFETEPLGFLLDAPTLGRLDLDSDPTKRTR